MLSAIFFFVYIHIALLTEAMADPASLHHGETMRDCPECPELIIVKAGLYQIGDTHTKFAQPPQQVSITRPFALARFETTFDDWQLCVDDQACPPIKSDHKWGRGTRPVINVTYNDIETYLDWLSAKTQQTYRLPTEQEWEYAARAGTQTNYWWGDTVGDNQANCRGCNSEWSGIKSAPVGSFQPNPWGFYDMHGNVWEWTQSCWTPRHDTPRDQADCRTPVMRGGSWYYIPALSRSSYRYKNPKEIKSYNISYRILRELSNEVH